MLRGSFPLRVKSDLPCHGTEQGCLQSVSSVSRLGKLTPLTGKLSRLPCSSCTFQLKQTGCGEQLLHVLHRHTHRLRVHEVQQDSHGRGGQTLDVDVRLPLLGKLGTKQIWLMSVAVQVGEELYVTQRGDIFLEYQLY